MSDKNQNKKKNVWFAGRKAHLLCISALAILIYSNTLNHEYTQDDAIVIYENMFVTDGISGISDILTKDTFYGFFREDKSQLVAGGRYRPLSLLMFAFGWEIFGNNPFIGHLINVLLYALLGLLIYIFIERLLKHQTQITKVSLFALLASCTYIAHPIHTEAIANIKGRDEILCMLFSILSLYFLLSPKGIKTLYTALISGLCFFLALLAKENAITFLAIAPLSLFFFKSYSITKSIKSCSPLIAAAFLFILIRLAILGWDVGSESTELMNNPYIKVENNNYIAFTPSEKYATISYTLGKYLQLLAAPITLTHDYYPRHIDIMSFSNWKVLLSLLANLSLIAIALFYYKKKSILSYGILYYFITISIVSNLVFAIGTNMSERFLFMPSLGFAIIVAYIFYKATLRFGSSIPLILFGIIMIGYSIKTIDRNQVWKDNFTLFTTDVKTSFNSAKMLNAAGGAIQTKYGDVPDGKEKTDMLNQAITYLNKATEIHPNYKNAYLINGNCNFYLKNYDQAITLYSNALKLDNNYVDARKNLAVAYREGGKYYGEIKNDIIKSKNYLVQSYKIDQQDLETLRLLGVVHGISGDHNSAIKYFTLLTEKLPNNASAFLALSTAYRNANNIQEAEFNLNKALSLDPEVMLKK